MTDKNDIYLQNIPRIKDTLEYKVDNNKVSVMIDNNHRIQRFFRKLGFKIATQTSIDLDQYSSFVFLQIDGQRDIYTIGQNLKLEFGADAEPLYERLVTFIDFLEDNRRWVLFTNKMY